MKWADLHVTGVGSYLPEGRETAAEALAAGRWTEKEQQRTGQRSASVADAANGETAAEMALAAGRRAVASAGVGPGDIGLLVHVVSLHNGLEMWPTCAYLQHELRIPDECLPMEVRSACAGSVVAMEMIGRWFGGRGSGLVTAGDVWSLPLIDRWATQSGLVFGDGAGAVVVGPEPGPFRLLSTAIVTDSSLELLHRGADTNMPHYRTSDPIDLRTRSRRYDQERGFDEFGKRYTAAQQRVVDTALADAGIRRDDVRRWSFSHTGERAFVRNTLDPLGLRVEQTLNDFGLDIGHTGATDPLLALDRWVATGAVDPSDHVALVGIGGGFTFACAVLQATELIGRASG